MGVGTMGITERNPGEPMVQRRVIDWRKTCKECEVVREEQ